MPFGRDIWDLDQPSSPPPTDLLCAARCGSLGVEEQDDGVLALEAAQGKSLPLIGPTRQAMNRVTQHAIRSVPRYQGLGM